MNEKKWWKSKIVKTMAVAVLATMGGLISGELQVGVAVPALIFELATLAFRLFATNTNLTT